MKFTSVATQMLPWFYNFAKVKFLSSSGKGGGVRPTTTTSVVLQLRKGQIFVPFRKGGG